MSGYRSSFMPTPRRPYERPPTPVASVILRNTPWRPALPPDDGKPEWFRRIVADAASDLGENGYALVMGDRRTQEIVAARHRAYRDVLEAKPRMSVAEVGRLFNRNHTTVLSALGRTKVSKARLSSPPRGRRYGDAVSTAAVSDEIAREIAAVIRAPNAPTQWTVARQFGVREDTVSRIARGLRRDRAGEYI